MNKSELAQFVNLYYMVRTTTMESSWALSKNGAAANESENGAAANGSENGAAANGSKNGAAANGSPFSVIETDAAEQINGHDCGAYMLLNIEAIVNGGLSVDGPLKICNQPRLRVAGLAKYGNDFFETYPELETITKDTVYEYESPGKQTTKLHFNDLKSLDGKNYLNGSVVDFVIDVITGRAQQNMSTPSTDLVLGSLFSYYTLRREDTKPDNSKASKLIQRAATKQGVKNARRIIIPVNVPSTHWYLFCIDNEDRTVSWVDSFRENGPVEDYDQVLPQLVIALYEAHLMLSGAGISVLQGGSWLFSAFSPLKPDPRPSDLGDEPAEPKSTVFSLELINVFRVTSEECNSQIKSVTKELRQETVDWIRNSSPECVQETCAMLGGLQQRGDSGGGSQNNLDLYLKNMAKASTWGGEPELAALANLQKKPILVFEQVPT